MTTYRTGAFGIPALRLFLVGLVLAGPASAAADEVPEWHGVKAEFETWGAVELDHQIAQINQCDERVRAMKIDPESTDPKAPRWPVLPDYPTYEGPDKVAPGQPLPEPKKGNAFAASCYRAQLQGHASEVGKHYVSAVEHLDPDTRAMLKTRCQLSPQSPPVSSIGCIYNAVKEIRDQAEKEVKNCGGCDPAEMKEHQRIRDHFAFAAQQLGLATAELRYFAVKAGTCAGQTLSPGPLVKDKDQFTRPPGKPADCYAGKLGASDDEATAAIREFNGRMLGSGAGGPFPTLDGIKIDGKDVEVEKAPTPKSTSVPLVGPNAGVSEIVWSCISNTYTCANELCGLHGPDPRKACQKDMRATEALAGDVGAIVGSIGVKPPNALLVDYYVRKMKTQALANLRKAYADTYGDYDVLEILRGPGPTVAEARGEGKTIDEAYKHWQGLKQTMSACFKPGNEQISDALKKSTADQLLESEGNAAAYQKSLISSNAKKSDEYKKNMVIAADDLSRNLLQLAIGSAGAAPGGKMGPDIGCPCVANAVKLPPEFYFPVDGAKFPDWGGSPLGGQQASFELGQAVASPACVAECCPNGLSGAPIPGTCTNGEQQIKDDAERRAAVIKTLREFPELASGAQGLDDLASWTTARKLPNIRALILASRTPEELANLRLSNLGARPVPLDDAKVKAALAMAERRSRRDFAEMALKYCAAPPDGGANLDDLVRVKSLSDDMIKNTPEPAKSMLRVVQGCEEVAAQSKKSDLSAINFLSQGACFVGTIASAGALGGPCAALFIGLSAHEYADASHHKFMTAQCASTASSGICTAADQAHAEAAAGAAFTGLVIAGAGGVFEGVSALAKGAQILAQATKASERLKAVAPRLTAAEVEALEARIASVEGAKAQIKSDAAVAAAKAQELETIAQDAEKLGAAHVDTQTRIAGALEKEAKAPFSGELQGKLAAGASEAETTKKLDQVMVEIESELDKIKDPKLRAQKRAEVSEMLEENLAKTGCLKR